MILVVKLKFSITDSNHTSLVYQTASRMAFHQLYNDHYTIRQSNEQFVMNIIQLYDCFDAF